jgi:nitrite reductase (cytochrome c-552)
MTPSTILLYGERTFLKASQGFANYDVNTMATRQEMRSYVCGQCHVTYYFQPRNKRLTFPWAKGIKVEDIIAVEDEQKINEWTHPDSGTQLIKARHPEFEMWNQGVHSRSGVACADSTCPTCARVGSRSAITRSTARC